MLLYTSDYKIVGQCQEEEKIPQDLEWKWIQRIRGERFPFVSLEQIFGLIDIHTNWTETTFHLYVKSDQEIVCLSLLRNDWMIDKFQPERTQFIGEDDRLLTLYAIGYDLIPPINGEPKLMYFICFRDKVGCSTCCNPHPEIVLNLGGKARGFCRECAGQPLLQNIETGKIMSPNQFKERYGERK